MPHQEMRTADTVPPMAAQRPFRHRFAAATWWQAYRLASIIRETSADAARYAFEQHRRHAGLPSWRRR